MLITHCAVKHLAALVVPLAIMNILWCNLLSVQIMEYCTLFVHNKSKLASEWTSVCVAWQLTSASGLWTLTDNSTEPIRNKDSFFFVIKNEMERPCTWQQYCDKIKTLPKFSSHLPNRYSVQSLQWATTTSTCSVSCLLKMGDVWLLIMTLLYPMRALLK